MASFTSGTEVMCFVAGDFKWVGESLCYTGSIDITLNDDGATDWKGPGVSFIPNWSEHHLWMSIDIFCKSAYYGNPASTFIKMVLRDYILKMVCECLQHHWPLISHFFSVHLCVLYWNKCLMYSELWNVYLHVQEEKSIVNLRGIHSLLGKLDT